MRLTLAQTQQQIAATDYDAAYAAHCTYWNHKGLLQPLYEQLNNMIPSSGACEKARGANKHLDRMRRAANCMYDLYNNGLCNRQTQFNRMFDVRSSDYGSYRYGFDKGLYKLVESKFDAYVALAAQEQGLID